MPCAMGSTRQVRSVVAPRDEVKHPNSVACDSMREGELCTFNERIRLILDSRVVCDQ